MPHELAQPPYLATDDRDLLDFDVVHSFLSTCYWSPGIPRALIEKAASNSVPFGVYDLSASATRPAQVGYARVVSDFATFAYLADVFVIEAHRGRGLSILLVRCAQTHPRLQGLRRWLLMTRDAHGVYAKCGFTPLKDPGAAMEITRRDIYLSGGSSAPAATPGRTP